MRSRIIGTAFYGVNKDKKLMNILKFPSKDTWREIIKRPVFEPEKHIPVVKQIIDEIRDAGDEAVRKYTSKFDHVHLDNFSVTDTEVSQAINKVDEELKQAIQLSIRNITKFHESQRTGLRVIETLPGVRCWQKAVAIEKVGLYVPGGTAPLFSTVLMLGIPAKIAGCKEIVLCTPPGSDGSIHPALIYAAEQIGIKQIFKIGGVQSIAAMAYGTETVPKVYKIFGPGNQYVTTAKQLVSLNEVAIDMPAGPSEVAVMADETAIPDFVAADLLSQAEHGSDSQVILVTNQEQLIGEVQEALNKQLNELPRKELAQKSLAHSKVVLVRDQDEMIRLINAYAPEHLIISMKDAENVADRIINAGSVFIGNYTPESVGDYTSGTNHTLPTNGFARVYNGVNLDSYVKKITFQHLSEKGLKNIGQQTEKMAQSEELTAHARAVSLRLNTLRKK
jgi:histidinol dehydrogenase